MSVGAVQVLNVQNKPTLISLSTKYGTQCDSTLSDVTWAMQETITAADDNFTAVVSIHSMFFQNTFSNIFTGENDAMQILSTWVEAGVSKQSIINIAVPQGQYNIETITSYLTSVCNETVGGYFYGMGGFTVTADTTKVQVDAPTAGTTGILGTYNAAHVYTGFYLIANEKTIPLLSVLGLVELNQENKPTNIVRISDITGTVAYSCIGFTAYNNGSTSHYTYSTPYTAPTGIVTAKIVSSNVTELQGPCALSVSWEVATSNARDSFNKLSTGNTIGVVPVNAPYGYRSIYEPSNPFKCIIPNFNVNQFKITIRNSETGDLVDFQGSDWVLNLSIEFFEMDNTHKSEMANNGYYRNVMPNMHNTVYNHNLPNSGTTGYSKKKARKYIDSLEYFGDV